MTRWVILCLMLLFPLIASANPFVCDDTANTCTYNVSTTESTKTVAGGPLTNLKQVNLKTSLNSGPFATVVVPATAPTGGGAVSKAFTFATVACAVTTFTAKASETNTLLLEGPETAPVSVTRDRTQDPTCAPAAPAPLVVN